MADKSCLLQGKELEHNFGEMGYSGMVKEMVDRENSPGDYRQS